MSNKIKDKFIYNFPYDLIIFDFETGGLNPEPEIEWINFLQEPGSNIVGKFKTHRAPILEIAAVKLDQVTLEEKDHFHTYCGPEDYETIEVLMSKCQKKALEVNNISQDILESAPPCSKKIKEFLNWASNGNMKNNFIFGGQNVRFDIEMLLGACKEYGIDFSLGLYTGSPEDLKNYSRLYFALPDTPIVPNYKLETVASALGIDIKGLHGALPDVRMTAECLRRIYKRFIK